MLSRKIFVKASGIECFNSVLRFTHTKKSYDDVVNVSILMKIFLMNKFYTKSVIYNYSISISTLTPIN